MKTIRVLHCPDIVGGNPANLARAERKLGLQSWAITFRQTVFSYPIDEVLLKPSDGVWAYFTNMFKLLWKALRNYDVIHYNFGKTIIPYVTLRKETTGLLIWLLGKVFFPFFRMIDLPILHSAGKGILVTFQGDDVRQGDYCLRNFRISTAHFVEPDYYTTRSDVAKRKLITKFDQYADFIYYLNPDLGYILPERAKFMPYAHVDLNEWEIIPFPNNPRPLVVHAPSHRGIKGTDIILQAVKQLKKEGADFDFQLVEGLKNKEAREVYERADLLIDQLYAGWYGGLSVELMALGKPVMCYIRESDLKFIPKAMRMELPIIMVTSDTLQSILFTWLTEKKQDLPSLGIQSRFFVEKWHNPLKIASQLREDYLYCFESK